MIRVIHLLEAKKKHLSTQMIAISSKKEPAIAFVPNTEKEHVEHST